MFEEPIYNTPLNSPENTIGIITGTGTAIADSSANAFSTFNSNLNIVWQVRGIASFTQEFLWNTGEIPLTWYRIQGCCKYPTPLGSGIAVDGNGTPLPGGCEVIGIETDDTECTGALGKQQFIQNVLARGLDDLCNILTESRLNWEICSIKKYSRPADGRLVSPEDQCNTLTEVPFSQLPSCLPFTINTDVVIKMKITTFTIDSMMVYTASGGAFTGGSADMEVFGAATPTQTFFEYYPDGGTTSTGGSADVTSSWQSELITTMGISTTVESLEAVFGTTFNDPTLAPLTQTISTACGTCSNMPLILYFFHNINSGSGILTNFMQRNGILFPSPLVMYYSARLKSWVANLHMIGTSDDNMTTETWRFTFEWACQNQISGANLGSSLWKFSMLAVRENQSSKLDFDTRLMLVFPPEQICSGTSNLGFDFSFNMNTVTKFVNSSLGVVPNIILLMDNVGLFASKYWATNPNLNIRLSQSSSPIIVQRQDISSIFPTVVPPEATTPFITR